MADEDNAVAALGKADRFQVDLCDQRASGIDGSQLPLLGNVSNLGRNAMVTAPIGAQPLGAWESPDAKSFLVFSPERMWMAFAQSRSAGALANSHSGAPLHPDDAQTGSQVFDSLGEFPYKYYARRKKSG